MRFPRQFSLRTLLIVSTLIGVVGGLGARWRYNAATQRAVAAHYLQNHVRVYYDYECHPSGWPLPAATSGFHLRPGLKDSPLSNWLENWLGIDYFYNVVCVDFTRSTDGLSFTAPAIDVDPLPPEELEWLAQLNELKVVYTWDSSLPFAWPLREEALQPPQRID